MQIAWRAAVDEPAYAGRRTEHDPRSGRDNVGPSPPNRQEGCSAAEFSRTEAKSARCRSFRRDRRPVQDTGSVRRWCPTRPGCPKSARPQLLSRSPAGRTYPPTRLPRAGLQPRRAYKHRFSRSREYPIVMIGYVARRGSRCSRLVAVERHAPSASKFRL